MTRYVAIIDGGPGAYGISFPDAPGCVAMDKTIADVIAAGGEVLAEWVADVLAMGRSAPKARSAEKIRKDPEIAELLANGALLVPIPLLLDVGRSARANISIDAGLLAAIDEAARQQKVTRSAFLAAAARDKIKASA
jgi:predicted RNase H-like HicB family nuclease